MTKSESIVKLSTALLKAQKAMGGASKDSKNPFFKSNYSDYGSVLEVVKEPLNEHGVIVLQPHTQDATGSYVETMLVHAESGEYITSTTPVICAKANDPQAMGSAITYARRYGLQSLLSIPSVDDDGNSASGKVAVTAVPKVVSTVATGLTPAEATIERAVTGVAGPTAQDKAKSSFRKIGATPATIADSDF
jgi:ERF superfamily